MTVSVMPQNAVGKAEAIQYQQAVSEQIELKRIIKNGKKFIASYRERTTQQLHPLQRERELTQLKDERKDNSIFEDFGIETERQREIMKEQIKVLLVEGICEQMRQARTNIDKARAPSGLMGIKVKCNSKKVSKRELNRTMNVSLNKSLLSGSEVPD